MALFALPFLVKDYTAPSVVNGEYCQKADEVYGDCIGAAGDWSNEGYTKNHCPKGYSFTGEKSTAGCGPFFSQGKCKKTEFAGSKPLCCLNETNSKDCPPRYCQANLNGPECMEEVRSHCKNNLSPFGIFSDKCWEWAFNNDVKLIDDYCKQNNGAFVHTDPRCNEFAKSSRSHGKMDRAVELYCASPLSLQNAEKGETICNCFANHLKDENLKDLGKTAQPACWYLPCVESGYKTSSSLERMKTCGDFCAAITKNNTIKAGKDVDISLSCKGKAAAIAENINNQNTGTGNSTNDDNSKSNVGLYIGLGIAGFVLIFVIISIILYVLFRRQSNRYSGGYPQSPYSSNPYPSYPPQYPQYYPQ